jgi:hypothetical protein
MAERIVKLCLIRGFTEAYYQLSEEEQKKLWDKIGEGLNKVGSKMIGPYYNCRWSNDKYASFFLLEYPDTDAAIAETANADEAGLFRYIVSETILGIPQEET